MAWREGQSLEEVGGREDIYAKWHVPLCSHLTRYRNRGQEKGVCRVWLLALAGHGKLTCQAIEA